MIAIRYRRLLWFVLMAGLGWNAQAGTFVITEDELDPEIFPTVAESIRSNLDEISGSKLTRAKRVVVLRSLERMERFLAEDPRRHHDRIRQDQKRVNSALLPAVAGDGSRAQVVCRRIRDVGSHIDKTECRTRAEIDRESEAANRMLIGPRVTCKRPNCGHPRDHTSL